MNSQTSLWANRNELARRIEVTNTASLVEPDSRKLSVSNINPRGLEAGQRHEEVQPLS